MWAWCQEPMTVAGPERTSLGRALSADAMNLVNSGAGLADVTREVYVLLLPIIFDGKPW